MATKNYYIGPQDGWVEVITGASAAANVRISSVPHTHQFFVFGDNSATPNAVTDTGILVCHHPFKVTNGIAGSSSKYYIRVRNPVAGSAKGDGRLRLDVYTDGGTVA